MAGTLRRLHLQRSPLHRSITTEILMKNKRPARPRAASMFAPFLPGTIAAPALRPVRVPATERGRGKAFSDGRVTRRKK